MMKKEKEDAAGLPRRSERLDLLQVMRGAAAVGVVVQHDVLLGYGKLPNINLGDFLGGWGWTGVDAFFCISGFIMAWVHGKDIGVPNRALPFVLKRFFRIYPPYIAALLVVISLDVISAAQKITPPPQLASIMQSILLFAPGGTLLLGLAWTLVHEILFYTLFCAAIILGRKVAIGGVILWIAGIFIYPHPDRGTSSQFCDLVFSPFNLEFLAGLAVVPLVLRTRSIGAHYIVLFLSGVALVAGFPLGWWHNFKGEGLAPSVPEKVAMALCFSGLIFGLVGIESRKRLRVPSFLVFIGSASYSIYLIHGSTIRLLRTVLPFKLPALYGHPVEVYSLLSVMAILAVAAGMIFYVFVERPLLRYARNWQTTAPQISS